MKQLYLKLVDKIDTKKIGIVVGILFILTLIPVIYVGFFNYATGDDYWYGVHTYRGWIENGLPGALRGSVQTVAEFYENWQGTWFTMFLFTLSPNHFVEEGYIITVFLSLGLLIGSYAYLAHFYLVKKLNFTKGAAGVVVCMISYLAIQYIPRTTSGIYWFNGIMHYSVPFFLGILAIVHSHKFLEEKKIKDYVILFVSFLLLGGGSYLAPLAATLAVCLLMVVQMRIQKISGEECPELQNEKLGRGNSKNNSMFRIRNGIFLGKVGKWELSYDLRNLWIVLAFLAEIIGLLISFLAPGNSVRGGEEFGADLKWALECIYYAIDRGIYLGEDYFLLNGVNTVVFLILAVFIWSQLWRVNREKVKFRIPLLFVVYMNGIYWASYTPEIYSRSDVSGGVPNTYFHIFLVVTFANMVYVHGWVQDMLIKYWNKKANKMDAALEDVKNGSMFFQKRYKECIGVPLIVVCFVVLLLVAGNSSVETTNDYCYQAIQSGQLERYADIREEQHRILSAEGEEDVIVPEMGAPYPLLHMLLLSDPTDSRNIDRAKYYNKNSVIAEKVE